MHQVANLNLGEPASAEHFFPLACFDNVLACTNNFLVRSDTLLAFCFIVIMFSLFRAGVGRTGTFIAFDMCLLSDTIMPMDAVDYMRQYRPAMVQTEKQWRFLLKSLAAKVESEAAQL